MTDGSLVTISSVVLAIVSVSALAAATIRSWSDAAGERRRRNADADADGRLRAQVRVLEGRIARLADEVEALRRPSGALRAPAYPGSHPSGQVAAHQAERFGDPGDWRAGVAAAENVIVFPGVARASDAPLADARRGASRSAAARTPTRR